MATTQATQNIPRLAEPLDSDPSTGTTTPRAPGADATEDKKAKKRGLFGFGKKKATTAAEESTKPQRTLLPQSASDLSSSSAATTTRRKVASPIQTEHPHFMPSSPGRSGSGFASPNRLVSPAGSQIFERDVQESAALMPNSPAIPSHIQTENYIPPVLDASSEAITDTHLDPDNVEIVTHTSHQPASVAVTGSLGANNNNTSLESSWADDLAAWNVGSGTSGGTETASNYGSLDNTTADVRRLSFISFADIVQADHGPNSMGGGGGGSRDSMYLAGLTSLSLNNRSPSPIRSPVSSLGASGTSPPTSKSGSVKGFELSPSRKPQQHQQPPQLGSSPTLALHFGGGGGGSGMNSPTVSGDLAIETMTQALRRTGSGDLSGVRSLPTSPI